MGTTPTPTIPQPKNYIKKGLFWILTPIILRFLVWGIFIATNSSIENNLENMSLLRIINYILSIIGLLSTIAIPVGLIVGVVYLIKAFKE